MGRPSKQFIAEGLARLRAQFPPPKPLYAEITLECVPGREVRAVVDAAKWERVRTLFAGQSDDEIVALLVDDVIDRFGLT